MTRLSWWVLLIASVVCATSALAGPEEDAVEKVLLAEAKSAAAFAETKDAQTVLKLYTADYNGVQDGELETRETIEKWLAEYGAVLDKGSRVHFLGAISNLKAHVAGSTAWATCGSRSRCSSSVFMSGLRPETPSSPAWWFTSSSSWPAS